jgi:hypothetical protein
MLQLPSTTARDHRDAVHQPAIVAMQCISQLLRLIQLALVTRCEAAKLSQV